MTFEGLCAWAWRHEGIPPTAVRRKMYRTGYEVWLALYLGERGRWIDYKKACDRSNPVEFVLKVWDACKHLPVVSKTHARLKLERLMRTGRMVPTARVPSASRGPAPETSAPHAAPSGQRRS